MLIHPLLRLAVSHPHVLGDHAQAYIALAGEEIKKVSSGWSVRIGLFVGAGVLALLGLIWAGVALLIVAAVPLDDYPAAWALWAVPLTPFLLAGVMVFIDAPRR